MTTDLDLHLLNDFQRDLPLVPKPFGTIAAHLGVSESEVLDALHRLQACGKISRVGAVFRPHSVGFSALAALAVPVERLDEAARLVSAYAEVNHNYEREHRYNLWFVVTAPDEARVRGVLDEIGSRTGCEPLYLPMLEDFHIDLGFDLSQPHKCRRAAAPKEAIGAVPSSQRALPQSSGMALLIGAIQHGLPLVSRPFAEIGAGAGLAEEVVIAGLAQLVERGTIKRMGVVVRHHELGYRANAMVVWDIPDERVSELGQRIGQVDFVTLCYSRPRRLPEWRYNLFTMIHGQQRDKVLGLVDQLKQQCGLQHTAHEILFSCRRIKQRGAHYVVGTAGEPVGEQCAIPASVG